MAAASRLDNSPKLRLNFTISAESPPSRVIARLHSEAVHFATAAVPHKFLVSFMHLSGVSYASLDILL